MRSQTSTGQRRHRYYAYEPRFGDQIMWMDHVAHEAMIRIPWKAALYQCSFYLGKCKLMTKDEWRAARSERIREQQKEKQQAERFMRSLLSHEEIDLPSGEQFMQCVRKFNRRLERYGEQPPGHTFREVIQRRWIARYELRAMDRNTAPAPALNRRPGRL